MKLKKIKIKVLGMHCSICTVEIDEALENIKGVKSAKTHFVREEVEVEFDPSVVKPDQLVATINEQGYKASLSDEASINN